MATIAQERANIPAEFSRAILAMCGVVFVGSVAASLDFPNILTVTSQEMTLALVGAQVGDTVLLGMGDPLEANLAMHAIVTVADVVTVRLTNPTAGTINPAAHTFTAIVLRRGR